MFIFEYQKREYIVAATQAVSQQSKAKVIYLQCVASIRQHIVVTVGEPAQKITCPGIRCYPVKHLMVFGQNRNFVKARRSIIEAILTKIVGCIALCQATPDDVIKNGWVGVIALIVNTLRL